ncbi:MAG: hypothetical protein V8T87_13410 [Victivallales bacterium]
MVFINRMPVHPQFAYFAVDYENTSRRLVSRLLKNGAERVAMIGGADYLAGKYSRTTPVHRAGGPHTASMPGMFRRNCCSGRRNCMRT